MEWIYRETELAETAASIWKQFPGQKVFALDGPMGAGKTTLIAALCRAAGITDTVSSPTFSLVNEYASPEGPVYHIDLYRLKDEAEAWQAGIEDLLWSGARCFVEWPSVAPDLLPPDALTLSIEIADPATRRLRAGSSPG